MSVLVKDESRRVDGDVYLELPWLLKWTRRKNDAWPFRSLSEARQSCVSMGLEPDRLRFVAVRGVLQGAEA